MTTVFVNRKYITKLVLQDLKRRWNRRSKEHEFKDKFAPHDFYVKIDYGEGRW